jgi:hypothetical protein
MVTESDGSFELREPGIPYSGVFGHENAVLKAKDLHFGNFSVVYQHNGLVRPGTAILEPHLGKSPLQQETGCSHCENSDLPTSITLRKGGFPISMQFPARERCIHPLAANEN